ncbi:hypothetical protein SAMN05421810_11469 [Amycolatopsis arida]|uniref:Uncharacterized protein n=1 Tax=Amycolatopsis arida TaxID=587909 RepID=A0A1I6ASI9_9PSEU|nr:hypothetical protein [Amycolatopsis arida]TDX97554.1 hypothetical protein CLV69_102658 [Amycolatopsis arida]SFQ71612.1 hypothetical protein SAMN05421810_11469 [Amycolatopsis arida]
MKDVVELKWALIEACHDVDVLRDTLYQVMSRCVLVSVRLHAITDQEHIHLASLGLVRAEAAHGARCELTAALDEIGRYLARV